MFIHLSELLFSGVLKFKVILYLAKKIKMLWLINPRVDRWWEQKIYLQGNSLDAPLNSPNYHWKKRMVISKKNYYGILRFKPMGKTVGPWRYYFCVRHTSRITHHASSITQRFSGAFWDDGNGWGKPSDPGVINFARVTRHASRNDSQAHFAMTQMTALVDIWFTILTVSNVAYFVKKTS